MIWTAFRFLTGTNLGRWIIAAVAVVAFLGWLRWDAAQDARDQIEREADKARIEHRDGAEKEKEDVEAIGPDGLLRELLERLRPDPDN
ncbi:hypothetical protein [Roseovarius sp.]